MLNWQDRWKSHSYSNRHLIRKAPELPLRSIDTQFWYYLQKSNQNGSQGHPGPNAVPQEAQPVVIGPKMKETTCSNDRAL